MAQTIRLHGGPWHGKVVALEDNRNHMHIIQPVLEQPRDLGGSVLKDPDTQIPTREGMYSRVHNSSTDFE